MKRLLIILTTLIGLLIIVGCGNTGKVHKSDWYYAGTSHMVSVYDMPISVHQLDSICVADTLSNDLTKWHKSMFIDFETRDTVYKHTFIKRYSETEEVIYIINEYRDSLSINKRIKY